MTDETLYRRLPHLPALLRGEIPDLTLTLTPTDKLVASLDKAKAAWQYSGSLFREARRNVRCRIPLMALLAYVSLTVGVVPTLDTLDKLVRLSPLATGDLYARCYQFHSSWLRELDAGIVLAAHAPVSKNLRDDLASGVDWMVGDRAVGVAHDGAASRHYMASRKAKKMEGVEVLTATADGPGVHCVPVEVLERFIASLADVESPAQALCK